MNGHQKEPARPRNGHTPVTGVVCRISGCANQKEVSLDDQVDHGKEVAEEVFPGQKIEYRTIATTGKGERLDRAELQELEALLRSRILDLLVAEDLGRIVRGAEAAWLLGIAVDHGTRVISPNDGIDTDDPTWEADALDACKEHVQHNAQVSRRLKQKLLNRFVKFGGAPARETYGYLVPDSAETYDDWSKDPAAEPIMAEIFRILDETLNYTAASDWLLEKGVPVGPYCRSGKWTGAMVRRLFQNPILKGKPGRGFRHTVKHHETGRRVSVPNPKGPKFYECPHLAFFPEAELDMLNARLAEKNAKNGRSESREEDPLLRVPRKRTRFPGQHARCYYCGRDYVWGGNGVTENLMCTGARGRHCWDSIGFNGEIAALTLVNAITGLFQQLTGFEHQFTELVQSASEHDAGGYSERWARMIREEKLIATHEERLTAAILEGKAQFLKDKLAELEDRQKRLGVERAYLERARAKPLAIPGRIADIWGMLQAEFARLTAKSPDFGDLMRRLVPEFFVYLVRSCDGGHPVPRARVRLNLAGCIDGAAANPKLLEWFSRTLTIDLFKPPQREIIRPAAVALAVANPGMSHRAIAGALSGKPTATAVGNALALHKKMVEMGLSEPYQFVPSPPADYTKLRRHLHPLYRFEPLPGYVPPSL